MWLCIYKVRSTPGVLGEYAGKQTLQDSHCPVAFMLMPRLSFEMNWLEVLTSVCRGHAGKLCCAHCVAWFTQSHTRPVETAGAWWECSVLQEQGLTMAKLQPGSQPHFTSPMSVHFQMLYPHLSLFHCLCSVLFMSLLRKVPCCSMLGSPISDFGVLGYCLVSALWAQECYSSGPVQGPV